MPIAYADKDNAQPNTDPRKLWRDVDCNEVKNVVNADPWKLAVRVATVANGTLASAFANGQVVNGVTLATGDRILIKDQSTQSENGIHTVNASGAPTRAIDADTDAKLSGAIVYVRLGTVGAGAVWKQTTDMPTINSSNIVFVPYPPLATNTAAGIVEYSTPAEDITGTAQDRAVTPEGLHGKVIGTDDLSVPAGSWTPRVTNGCAPLAQTEIAGSLINIETLDFNQTTQQYAQWKITLPRRYALTSFTFRVKWTSTVASGGVAWSVAAVALGDGDALNTAFGTAVVVTDAVGSADTVRETDVSATVTVANSPASRDTIVFQLSRVTGDAADTLAGDAKFAGISFNFTATAAKDA
jgi:hypothetical protein